MGKKVSKTDILNGIKEQINKCLEYQKQDPDKSALKRVNMLEQNPVKLGKFFVNVTLTSPEVAQVTKLTERVKRIQPKKRLCTVPDMNSLYEAGCLIEVSVEKGAYTCISVRSFGSYASLVGALVAKCLDDSNYVTVLKPTKPASGDNYVEDDIRTATAAGKSSIIYSIARFSNTAVIPMLELEFNTEKYDIYSFSLNNMIEAKYVDMSRATSLEQNVNEFFGGTILNDVTMFGSKSKIPDFGLKKAHSVYDMCVYVSQKLNEIKNCDEAQANKLFKFYTETRDDVFLSNLEAKYKGYKDCGGSGEWADWNTVEAQFLTYKAAQASDSNIVKLAEESGSFISNVLACEKALSLYSNSEFKAIKSSWNDKVKSPFVKYKSPGAIEFAADYPGDAKAAAQEFVMATMVDAPSIVINPVGGSKIKFNDNIFYSFSVAGKTSMSAKALESERKENGKTVDQTAMLGDRRSTYLNIKGSFKSNNYINVNRDIINLEGITYEYTAEPMKLDKDIHKPYMNDINLKKDVFDIPKETYYNATDRVFFEASKLDDRFKECTIYYNLIPKVVPLPYTFVQESSFELRAQADERLKKVKEEYKDRYLRCCVDTLNFDPWDVVIDKLKKLYGKWALRIPKDDMFEFPPLELTDMSDEKCKKCGKTKDKCKCDNIKLCTKCYPLNLYGIKPIGDDESDETTFGFMSAASYIYDSAGRALTFAEIAKSIYDTVYKPTYYIPPERFSVKNFFSAAVLSISYLSIVNAKEAQVAGTVASKFTSDRWTRFIEEYATGLYSGENMYEKQFTVIHRVGIADGYAYIPTGHEITFEFDKVMKTVTVRGANQLQTALMLPLALMKDDAYKASWKTIATLCAPLSEDMKKFIAFPCIPALTSILNGAISDVDEPDELDETYIYILDEADLFYANLSPDVKTYFRFYIYKKRPVLCNYPKDEDPDCRSKRTCGYCGFREMFEKPMILNPYDFDLEKEVAKKYISKDRIKMKKVAKDLVETTADIKRAACDVTQNLQKIEDINAQAVDAAVKYADEKRDLIALAQGERRTSNADSILEYSIKKAILKSVMDDYDNVFNKTARSIEVVMDDNFDVTRDKMADLITNISTISEAVKFAEDESAKASTIYGICNKKFSNYLTDKNTFKTIDTTIVNGEKVLIEKSLERSSAQKISEGAIDESVERNEIDLTVMQRDDLKEAIKHASIDGVKTAINAETIDEAADKILKHIKVPEGKENLMEGLAKDMREALAPDLVQRSLKSKFTTPIVLAKGVAVAKDLKKTKNTIGKAAKSGVSKGVDKAVKTAVESALGVSGDASSGGSKSAMDVKSSLSNSSADKAKKSAASSAISTAKSIVESAISPYLKNLKNVAGEAGISAGLTAGQDIGAAASSAAAGLVKAGAQKSELKDTISDALDPMLKSLSNSLPAGAIPPNAASSIANEVDATLSKKVSEEVSTKVTAKAKGSITMKLNAVKVLMDEDPAMKAVVDASFKKDNGEASDVMIAFVNGSGSLSIENQDNKSTSDSIANGTQNDDALVQVYKFIKDSCDDFQKLTGEFITFDS